MMYRDRWAPTVKNFWAKVVEPFRSWALHNLDPSHLLGTAMCLNWGAKILDYGVCKHIAFICAPFFEGIESQSQYEKRRHRWEECQHTQMAVGDHHSPFCSPSKRTQEQDEWGSERTRQGGRSHSESRRRQDIRVWQSHSTRRGGSWPPREKPSYDSSSPWDQKLPTPPQPSQDKVVKEVDTPETKAHQMAFRDAMEIGHSSFLSWEDELWEEEEQKWDDSITESSPEPDMPPPTLEGGMPVMSPWSMTISASMIQMLWSRRKGKRIWRLMCLPDPQPPHLPKSHWGRKGLRPGTLTTSAARHLRRAWIKTHPITWILMRMSYWGWSPTSLFPGDIWKIPLPLASIWGRMTYDHLDMKHLQDSIGKWVRRNGVRFVWTCTPNLV